MGKSKSQISGSGGYFDKLFGGHYGDYSYTDMVSKFLYDVSSSAQGSNIGANQLAYLESLQQQEYETSERVASQQWEEDYYNKYSSPAAMVRQYEEAGLNPALMYGGAGASTGEVPSSQPGSSSGAEPVNPVTQLDVLRGVFDSFRSIVDDASVVNSTIHQAQVNKRYNEQVDQELALQKSQEVENYAKSNFEIEQTETEGVKRDWYRAKTKESKHQVFLIDSQIQKIFSDIEVNEQNIEESKSRVAKNESDIKVNEQYIEVLKKDVGLKDEQIRKARSEWMNIDEQTRKLMTESMYGYFFDENRVLLQSIAALNNSNVNLNVTKNDIELFKQHFREVTGVEFGSDLGQVMATSVLAQMIGNEELGIEDIGQPWRRIRHHAQKASRRQHYNPAGSAAVFGAFSLAGRAIGGLGGSSYSGYTSTVSE